MFSLHSSVRSLSVTAIVNRCARWLSFGVSPYSLAFFRILFGFTMLWWTIDYLRMDRVHYLCNSPKFHFTYYGFGWVQPWPGDGMKLQFLAMALAAFFVAVGALYRFSALVLAFGFTHFFLIDRTNYQNHYYLVTLLCWWMAIVPAHTVWSIDGFQRKPEGLVLIPRWALLLIQFHIAVPYFYGGIAKFDADWLSGDPMRAMLLSQPWFSMSPLATYSHGAALLLTLGGLLFDLLVVPALVWKRTRTIAYCCAVAFHMTNAFLFNIHIFPWLMMGATTILFQPDWPQRLLFGVSSRITRSNAETLPGIRPWMTVSVMLYMAFHLIWPFRHHAYGPDCGWTEKGHFFSWRMMLRGKTTGIRYYVVDPESGRNFVPDIRDLLNDEQLGKFARDPEMILDLAHFIDSHFENRLNKPLEVHALVLTSLNGRKPQLLIDPAVDLAAQPRGWHFRNWIMPLTEPRRSEPWTVPLNEWERHVELPSLPFLRQPDSDCDISKAE